MPQEEARGFYPKSMMEDMLKHLTRMVDEHIEQSKDNRRQSKGRRDKVPFNNSNVSDEGQLKRRGTTRQNSNTSPTFNPGNCKSNPPRREARNLASTLSNEPRMEQSKSKAKHAVKSIDFDELYKELSFEFCNREITSAPITTKHVHEDQVRVQSECYSEAEKEKCEKEKNESLAEKSEVKKAIHDSAIEVKQERKQSLEVKAKDERKALFSSHSISEMEEQAD